MRPDELHACPRCARCFTRSTRCGDCDVNTEAFTPPPLPVPEFTREQLWRAMEAAADPDNTWDTMAEREMVFTRIAEQVSR